MKTSKKYTREIKKQLGYWATWLPGTPIELGDVGVLKGNQFVKRTDLGSLGVSFEIEEDNTVSDVEHNSSGAVSISFKASGVIAPEGSVLEKADAGISVGFSKKNAILFKAKNTTSPSIKDQVDLGKQVLKLYDENKWDKDWIVITEVVNAESATIIISSSAKSKIDLKVDGEVGASNLDIADAELNFGIAYSKDLSTSIIAKESLTPLFKASKVKDKWFKNPEFIVKEKVAFKMENDSKLSMSNVQFGEVDFDLSEED